MSDHGSPPRENLIRAMPGIEFRSQDDLNEDLGPGYLGLLRIRFSPVNEWSEINSAWEGRFMERFAPGAWKKTIRESASKIRALFQHGQDPQVGDKPLGPFRTLEENEGGGYAEVALLDTSYNRDLLPGLKDDLYGASHRFMAMRATEDDRPERSEHNPEGIKERTITEARLFELGPVTFPAYAGTTAGMRSMTDEFLMSAMRSDPDRLREMFDRALSLDDITPASQKDEVDKQQDAPSEDDAAAPEPHLADERRETVPEPATSAARAPIYGNRRKEKPSWLLEPSKSTKRS
jgi:HK97 family phage prohead protease